VGAGGSQVSPAERSRLQKCFQTGTQNAATNVDYAIEMFAICVAGDPGNAIYLQSLIGVLKRKFGSRKSGGLGALWSAGSRAGLKKLASNAQWRDLLKQGIDILKANPADIGTLLAMADACGQLQFHETQRVYLKTALDAAPADPDVNRQCAAFLANHGEFDQAIACWVRVSQAKGLAEEAQREIARLQVEKTIVAGHGLVGRAGPTGATRSQAAPATASAGEPAGGPVAALREAIRQKPTEIDAYLELADLLEREGTVDEAEKVLSAALAASGNDIKVREHYEDRHLRWARHRVHVAEKRVEAEDTEATRSTLERLRAAQLKQEIEIYSARCQRYPENLTWKYELAMRLKSAGNHTEAIKQFQEVLQDARRKGAVSLELGECFQKIKQYPLAMRNYQTAVETLTDREMDLRKRALYRAGVLAAGLQDVDAAQKYLSTLAEVDFGYRDVAERLDKLASLKDKGAL
jgi:tetratricopeptide (TPR) repeat protein